MKDEEMEEEQDKDKDKERKVVRGEEEVNKKRRRNKG